MARTVADVRGYLLSELNSALRRTGMYGGEMALRLYFDAVAYADEREQDWRRETDLLPDRGAGVSTGVSGAGSLAFYLAMCEQMGLPRPNVLVD